VAVAGELNVRRAAQRLHVSQPPLRRQIHDLEDELGTKLFDRTNKKLTLTPAGESFLKEARQILAQVQRAAQLAQAASRGEAGQLSIGILPPIGGLFLPPAIRPYESRATASIASCVANLLIPGNNFDCDRLRDADRNP